MKYLKLFESYYTKEATEVYEDIKSILYLLEDDGYDFNVEYIVKKWDSNSMRYLLKNYYCDDYQHLVGRNDIKEFYVGIFIDVFNNNNNESYKDDVERFFEILKDHLDYVDSRKDHKIISLKDTNNKPFNRIFIDLR
jgi:hypothetical protein